MLASVASPSLKQVYRVEAAQADTPEPPMCLLGAWQHSTSSRRYTVRITVLLLSFKLGVPQPKKKARLHSDLWAAVYAMNCIPVVRPEVGLPTA